MRTDQFDYQLPAELIAQSPQPRGESRLLIVHRTSARIEHRRFADLPDYLIATDTLVLNDTRVTGRRIAARRESGLPAEVLLLAPHGDKAWRALVRPGRPLRPGRTITLVGPHAEVDCLVISETDDGGRILELPDENWRDTVGEWGATPLPPYIHRPLAETEQERYQTVYNRRAGSAAAPTAGLHFTDALLESIWRLGVQRAVVTLSVGVGTFRPVRTEHIEEHSMHHEEICVPPETVCLVNRAPGRVIAVGTTTVRALESAANPEINPASQQSGAIEGHARTLAPYFGSTDLFITPGYRFRVVDAMLTNFHQPRSTLLMMVSAFAGCDLIGQAYAEALAQRYRFLSFGDAMLIL